MRADHGAAAAGRARRCAASTLYAAAGAGPDHRFHGRPRRSTSSFSKAATPRALAPWVPQAVAAPAAAPELANVVVRLRTTAGCSRWWISTATPRRASASPPPPSTTRSTTPSASASSPPSSRQSNQYRVILEADPSLQQLAGIAQRHLPALGRRRPGAARRRSRTSRADRARSQIDHLGQFPAATFSFDVAPWRLARRTRSRRSGAAEQQSRPAGEHHDHLPGRRARVRGLAAQRAAADPRGDRVRVHRAGRAVRELHPPADDPVDAALGRHRRVAGADDRGHGPRRHRASSASSC